MRRDYVCAALVSVPLLFTLACRAPAEPPSTATTAPPTAVQMSTVVARNEPVTLKATGSFAADESSDVAPEASGRVIATPVDVGQFVRSGAALVRLRGVDALLRLDEARAAVSRTEAAVRLAESQEALARTTSERYLALLATGDVSRTVSDQARTDAEMQRQNVSSARASREEARAQLAMAEKALGDVVVTAPFAGFISARPVSVGEYVQPTSPVATLVKVDPLRLQLTIPGVQAGRIAVGQKVTATVDAFPDRVFAGAISAVNPAIDPQSRSFVVEARVPNADAALKPGMFAVAQVDLGRTETALFVPKAAVIEDVNTDSYRVFVVDRENRARLRVVQLASRETGDPVRIVDGVKADERVATSALADLYDGAMVADAGGAAASQAHSAGTETHAEAR